MMGGSNSSIFPGVAMTLAVLGFNLVGDSVRDILDPRLRGSTWSRAAVASLKIRFQIATLYARRTERVSFAGKSADLGVACGEHDATFEWTIE